MKSIALILLGLTTALPACGPRHNSVSPRQESAAAAPAAGGASGDFRGYVAIDQALRERLFTSDSQANFFLGRYFGENNESFRGLQNLLGGFVAVNGSSNFEDGDPNAMNMLLWQIAFNGFAADLAKICSQPALTIGGAKLDDATVAVLKRSCAWPAADAKSDGALEDLWLNIVAYDAPENELDAWKSATLADTALAQLAGAKALRALVMSMTMDPYFLLGSP